MSNPEIDIKQTLLSLCEVLQIDKPPTIKWVDSKSIFADGVYCKKDHEISISTTVPEEALSPLIIHELCHVVLFRAGYKSSGHSAIFMATNRLMLLKAGLEDAEDVEGIASRNWNSWTPWPYWYRHILEAQEIRHSLSSEQDFLQSSTAQAIAHAVMEIKLKSYKKRTPHWVVFRWHEIIADTRGAWFALQDFCRLLFAVSILLLASPYSVCRQAGVACFGVSTVGIYFYTRKFKQK